jgi:phage gp46-like protein
VADWYIALTGNDTTGAGTKASPWRTWTKALTAAGNNDTIQALDAGPYTETVDVSAVGLTGVWLKGWGANELDAELRAQRLTVIDGEGLRDYCVYQNDDGVCENIWAIDAVLDGFATPAGAGRTLHSFDCRSSDHGANGWDVAGADSTWTRCRAHNNGNHGFLALGADVEFDTVESYENTTKGIVASGASRLENATVTDNGDEGVALGAAAATVRNVLAAHNGNRNYNCNAATIDNCLSYDGGAADIWTPDAETITGEDPLFVDRAGDNYDLQDSSPARGSGAARTAPSAYDVRGVAWEGAPSMGAFAFVPPVAASVELGELKFLAGLDGDPIVDTGFDLLPVGLHDVSDIDTLRTTVAISLFSDRLAEDGDELPIEDGPRGGWWADAYTDTPVGSRLWLLSRATVTDRTPSLVEEYATEALAWMIEDGLATGVEATAERRGADGINLVVTLERLDAPDVVLRYDSLWEVFRGS